MNYLMNNGYGMNYNAPTTSYSAPNFNFNAQGQQLVRVNGIDGARAYQMNPNSTVALFDTNEDIMYVKVTDGAGFPSIRRFSFTEVIDSEVVNNSDWISREEFEKFKAEVKDIGKQFIQQSKANDKPTNADD